MLVIIREMRAVVAAGFILAGPSVHAQTSDQTSGLPPPSRLMGAPGEEKLFLELVVNGLATGKIVSAIRRGDHFEVKAADLRAVNVRINGEDDEWIDLAGLTDVGVEYDVASLRLLVTVPASWLPEQQFGRQRLYDYSEARASFGVLLNYEAYLTEGDKSPFSAALWNELRLFGKFGSFSSTGVYQLMPDSAEPGRGHRRDRFTRYDTRWTYSDEARMLTFEAGDLVTRSLPWNSAVRIGGFQLSRDFSIRPDVVTYPIPEFSGDAALPTAVDLFVNGHRSDTVRVNPGPFTLSNIPFINGAGEAVVVTTDALGRKVSTAVPFYVTSDLLKPGLSDFALSAGILRRNYGLENFDYGGFAASGSYRYGLSRYLTLETHAEAGDNFVLGGVGTIARLGMLGVINAAYSQSHHAEQTGHQISVGYQYNMRRFNIAATHTRRSSDFFDLSAYATDSEMTLARRTTSVTGSVALDRFGSLGAGYFDTRMRDGERAQLVNLSWSTSIFGDTTLYASANREIGRKNWSAGLQLVVPLGASRGSVSANAEQSRGGRTSYRMTYSRSLPGKGGIGWNMSYAKTDGAASYYQADLSWRDDHFMLRGGIYGPSDDFTRWGNLSGSLIMMGDGVFAANKVSDSFVVVRTGDQSGVPVRYENQLVGKTDRSGRLLVPWTASYYRAKYEIDPLNLPASVSAPVVEQYVAVQRGAGHVIDFPIEHVRAARVVLHNIAGQPLSVGSAVMRDGKETAYVGWDGLVYLESLESDNMLMVETPEGERCSARFTFIADEDQLAQIGPISCR